MTSAVFSVVYPGVELYFSEFLISMSKQTDQDFTLFLVNDGLNGLEGLLKKSSVKTHVLNKKGSPAEIRKIGIEWVISQGFKIIIFADADDYFSNNRVEVSKKMLTQCDIVCNELLLFGEDMNQPVSMLEKMFKHNKVINQKHIINGNCMGLSNTAMRIDSIGQEMLTIPNHIVAFDWALFALCIYKGARTLFTSEAVTYYRQHHNNWASPSCFSQAQILRGVEVKKNHYEWFSHFYKEYVPLATSFESLFIQLNKDNGLKKDYCLAVQNHASPVTMWWEPIKLLKELGL